MKKSIMFLVLSFVLPLTVQASGCMPWDVSLQEESALIDIGEFKIDQHCRDGECYLLASTDVNYEYHKLLPQNASQALATADFGTMTVKIYRQFFQSDCGETTRYILGVDINGVRYREANDLTDL